MSLSTTIEKACNQCMVIWLYKGMDKFGSPVFHNPLEIKVRWSEESETITNEEGVEFQSNARILSTVNLSRRSLVMLGKKDEIPEDNEDPKEIYGTYEIRAVNRKPRLGGDDFLIYEAWI